MNDISVSLNDFVLTHNLQEWATEFNNVSQSISEESDMFGFSLIKTHREYPSKGVMLNNLQLLKDDDNWNNPGSISLMMQSFGLMENSWHGNKQSEFSNYIAIKREQQPIFADRHVQTGNTHMVAKKYKDALRFFVEALKCDSKSIDGMLGRASALLSLGHLVEASKQMSLISGDENDPKVAALRKRIFDQMNVSGARSTVKSSGNSNQATIANNVSFVDKLKLSLQSDRIGTTTTGQQSQNNELFLNNSSGSSGEDSEDDDDKERDQHSKSKKRKKEKSERRRKSKKHKRSRDDSDSDHSRRRKRSKSEKKSKKKHKHDSD